MKKRAQAAGDDYGGKNLKEMMGVAEDRSVDRKLTTITKRNEDGVLVKIEITTRDWFHSEQTQELYHYEEGNFEAYPENEENKFYTHHFVKYSQKILSRYL